MKKVLSHPGIFVTFLLGSWFLGLGGCATQEVMPPVAPPVSVPQYVQVAHPEGYDLGDVRGLFLDKKAPGPEVIKTCDADYRKLQSLTKSKEELADGARELIKRDPVAYHWCFYGKILELEDSLKAETYIDVRQKNALDTYAFLVPIARAFMAEFHDTRYLRFAIRHYRRISEWIFFKKLDLSPQMTSDLVDVASPFGNWREPSSSANRVLDKYSLSKPVDFPPAAASPAVPTPPAVPASPAVSPPPAAGLENAVPPETPVQNTEPVPAPVIPAS